MHKMNALLGRHFLEHFCKDTQYFVNRRQNKEKIKKVLVWGGLFVVFESLLISGPLCFR